MKQTKIASSKSKKSVRPTKSSSAKESFVKVKNTKKEVEFDNCCSECACSTKSVIRWILTPVVGVISTFAFTLLFTWVASLLKIPNMFINSCVDQLCVFNKLFIIFIVALVLAFIPTFFLVRVIAPKRKILSAVIFLCLMVLFIVLRLYGII